MLSVAGPRLPAICQGLSRRSFLRVGTLSVGGLTLADLFRLRGRADGSPPKSVIMVMQFGGPSHIDTFDMKPGAVAEVRGEFRPIRSRVPGLDVCELLPRVASITDRLAVVRSVQMAAGDHYLPSEAFTGAVYNHLTRTGVIRPVIGSVVSRVRGGTDIPPYVSLRGGESEEPAYLGLAHRPFVPSGPGLGNLSLPPGMTADRLGDRRALLRSFDAIRRDIDQQGRFDALDQMQARALDLVVSSRVRDALDLTREPDRVRQRYGRMTQYLTARRLVEAGVSLVTLDAAPIGWDTHSNNFTTLRRGLPQVDHGLHALVTDLCDRGRADDVLVLMWGEFGRTPRVNNDAGRDHWPEANSVVFAGGGLRMGQVIGATDSQAARPVSRPCTGQQVLATVYRVLGIDPARTFPDYFGRPVHLLEQRDPIAELL